MPASETTIRVGFPVDGRELSDLHARAFGDGLSELVAWRERLERHSLAWVGAFKQEQLVGFVHAVWDGGSHAFLLDAVTDPAEQRRGIGRRVISALVDEAVAAGCEWVHVDFEPHLAGFYEVCGFSRTEAGLLRLPRRETVRA